MEGHRRSVERSEPESADELVLVLRAGADEAALQRTHLGRRLLHMLDRATAVASWLDAVLREVGMPSRRGGACAARRAAILARYDRGGESRVALERELHLTRRRFYKERAAGLRRLRAAVDARLSRAAVHASGAETLARARAFDEAGNVEAALEIYREVAAAGPLVGRVRARALSGALLARTGRGAEARYEIALARRLNGELDRGERLDGEAAIHLAEVQRQARVHATRRLPPTLDRLRRCAYDAEAGESEFARLLTDGLLEAAAAFLEAGDVETGERLLSESLVHVARLSGAGNTTRARIGLLRSNLALRANNLAGAASLACDALLAARSSGVAYVTDTLLGFLAVIACAGGFPKDGLRLATELMCRAHLRGDVAARSDALLYLALAENALGRFDRALSWTDIARYDAGIDALGAVELELHRAKALIGLGHDGAALDVLDTVVRSRTASEFSLPLGVAFLLRSKIVSPDHDAKAARRDIEDSLDLLVRRISPASLAQAYDRAYALTHRRSYRDCARDLRDSLAGTYDASVAVMERLRGALDPNSPGAEPSGSAVRRLANPLTAREQTIAAHVRAGRSNGEIARALGVSKYTIDHHVKAILRKLDLERRHEIGAQLDRPLQPTEARR